MLLEKPGILCTYVKRDYFHESQRRHLAEKESFTKLKIALCALLIVS